MLKVSLVVLFTMVMATLTLAASAMPIPQSSRPAIAVAELG